MGGPIFQLAFVEDALMGGMLIDHNEPLGVLAEQVGAMELGQGNGPVRAVGLADRHGPRGRLSMTGMSRFSDLWQQRSQMQGIRTRGAWTRGVAWCVH